MVNRNSTLIQFWKFFPTTGLIGPPRLIDFGIFLIKQLFGRFTTASTGGQTLMIQLPFWPH